jgi:hypothetical protein
MNNEGLMRAMRQLHTRLQQMSREERTDTRVYVRTRLSQEEWIAAWNKPYRGAGYTPASDFQSSLLRRLGSRGSYGTYPSCLDVWFQNFHVRPAHELIAEYSDTGQHFFHDGLCLSEPHGYVYGGWAVEEVVFSLWNGQLMALTMSDSFDKEFSKSKKTKQHVIAVTLDNFPQLFNFTLYGIEGYNHERVMNVLRSSAAGYCLDCANVAGAQHCSLTHKLSEKYWEHRHRCLKNNPRSDSPTSDSTSDP